MSLQLATPIPSQRVVPGSTFTLSIHVHDTDGNNFNWSGYAPKATMTIGTVTIVATGTVVNQAGGTATLAWTAGNTLTLPNNQWGVIVIYADPTANTENRHVATIFCRTSPEEI